MPTCGPFLLLSPGRALGTPKTAVIRYPLCPHVGHFCFCLRAEHWEPRRQQGLGSHYAHMWAISAFLPVQSIGDPRDGKG